MKGVIDTLIALALGALHLPGVLFMLDAEVVRIPGMLSLLGFIIGQYLHLAAFLLTGIGLVVRPSLRRNIVIWAITAIGVMSLIVVRRELARGF